MSEYEAAVVDDGCLTHILTKYPKVFGESGKQLVVDLPQVAITTELRSTGHAVPLSNRMAKVACTTAGSRHYNHVRSKCKANACNITAGDQVMVKGQRITLLTSK